MAKKNESVEEEVTLTPKEIEIQELETRLRDLKEKGSFKWCYVTIRKETVEIKKRDINNDQKVALIIELCHKIINAVNREEE